jgi:hypothetical protein
MQFSYFHGPDRVPIKFEGDAFLSTAGTIPFHGIISRGLRTRCEAEGLPSSVWHQYAYLLWENVTKLRDSQFRQLQQFARECGVLSFTDSVFCARQYIERCYSAGRFQKTDCCELWYLKEGHTSSVWKVSVSSSHKSPPFVLNVARDQAASVELMDSSRKMQLASEQVPSVRIARVQDIQSLPVFPANTTGPVTVVRNEWIADAFEIHELASLDRSPDYILIDRFLTSKANQTLIVAVCGRRLTAHETAVVDHDMATFLQRTSPFFRSCIEINEGDLVWDGHHATVVALS